MTHEVIKSPELVYVFEPFPESSFPEYLLDCFKVIILKLDNFFPEETSKFVARASEEGITVFLATGQRGMLEQQNCRRKENASIRSGAISLGDVRMNFLDLSNVISKILSEKETRLEGIRAVVEQLYTPAIQAEEFGAICDFLEVGGSVDLGKFIYADYSHWISILKNPAYKILASNARDVFKSISAQIVKEMGQRCLVDYYSMGPTPELDVQILKAFEERKQFVRYHPIDTSPYVINKTLELIRKAIRSDFISLVQENPLSFDELETAYPCCVAYQGGQLVNDEGLMAKAAQICRKGGLVVADLHSHYEKNNPDLWKSFYDIPEEKLMFVKGVELLVPHLKYKDGWNISVEYLSRAEAPDRISFQLVLDRELPIYFNTMQMNLKPRIIRELMISKKYTGKELQKESEAQGFRIVHNAHMQLPEPYQRAYVSAVILERVV